MISYSAEEIRTKIETAFTKPKAWLISFEILILCFDWKASFDLWICVLDGDINKKVVWKIEMHGS